MGMGPCQAAAKRRRVDRTARTDEFEAPPPPDPPEPGPRVEYSSRAACMAANCAPPPPPPAEFPEPPAAGAEAPQGAEAARQLARQLLEHPEWRSWADGLVTWCEDNWLRDVESLYPEEVDYASRDTYRYLRLRALHPGSAFHMALLQENQRDPLDLSKVTHSPQMAQIATSIMNMVRTCPPGLVWHMPRFFSVWHMPHKTPLLHTAPRGLLWHMPYLPRRGSKFGKRAAPPRIDVAYATFHTCGICHTRPDGATMSPGVMWHMPHMVSDRAPPGLMWHMPLFRHVAYATECQMVRPCPQY